MVATIAALAPVDAIRALEVRGRNLAPSFSWQDVYAEEHAQSLTVAKSAGFDILNEIFAALKTALAEGKTFREFAATLTPLLQAKGWWGRQLVDDPATGERKLAQLGSTRRLQIIFDANLRVSYAAGHWANFERNKKARPWLRYVCIVDEHTRPEHLKRHNLCLPVDHPYWDRWAPPCGWNCRCTLQSLSVRDVERMRKELKFSPPPDDEIPWTNKRTGEIRYIPRGIDPGWDHNPGKAGWSALDAAEKLIAAPPELAAKANQDLRWLAQPMGADFEAWFDRAAAGGRVDRSTVIVGFLHEAAIEALTAKGLAPASGAISIDQQAVMHMIRNHKAQLGKTLDPQLLKRLPQLLATPQAILFDKRDPAIIYAFPVQGDLRLGKLVVRINYGTKAKPLGGTSQRIIVNTVRTSGLIEARNLADTSFYELIEGVL